MDICEEIKINYGQNTCRFCGKEYPLTTWINRDVDYPELRSVEFRDYHTKCRNLHLKIKKLRADLCNAEFEMFLKQYK